MLSEEEKKKRARERAKQYRLRDIENHKAIAKRTRDKHKDRHKERLRKYRSDPLKRDGIRKQNREYIARRKAEDPSFRLSRNLRPRVYKILKREQRGGSAIRDLGCSVQELQKYLEDKFHPHPITGEEMTWQNWSKKGWHIDHIIPLCKFDLTDPAQFKVAFYYTNLQPLWAEYNLKKRYEDL